MARKSEIRLHWGLIVGGFLVVLSIGCIYVAYKFFERIAPGLGNPKITDIRAALGQLGDFYGGVLNPILSFVTIVMVFVTLLMQRSELIDTQNELKIQRDQTEKQNKASRLQGFEQTFFAWLNSYREIISSIQYGNVSGRKALLEMFEDVGGDTIINDHLARRLDYRAYISWDEGSPDVSADEMAAKFLELKWNKMYLDNAFQLDTMFRTLYNLVRWIDNQPNDVLSRDEKITYMRILRSQISLTEGYLLIFNAFTERGGKFSQFINKYTLFDNVDPLPKSIERTLPYLNKFGLTEDAFGTDKNLTL